jgi:DUF1680 family protein
MGAPYPKAYEMTSFFEGVAEYYRATGDRRSLQAIQNYFNNVNEKEIAIIGIGGGGEGDKFWGESWLNTALNQSNPDSERMMETCVGVTWMKYCSQVMRLTGNPAAVDIMEKYIYNGLVGGLKPEGDDFSFVNMLNGRKFRKNGWNSIINGKTITCCNLNGPMGLASIPYIAITGSKEGPVINLYNTASAALSTPAGAPLRLTIETDFPQSGDVRIKVDPANPETFTLKLRIPSWSAQTVLKVNGKVQPAKPGAYAAITRQWHPDDRLEIRLDMRCRLLSSPPGDSPKGANRQALLYGPLVLTRYENIDTDYDQSVTVRANRQGFVEINKLSSSSDSGQMLFEVPTSHGVIRMVNYASVNNFEENNICTWMLKRE